ncbi:splicing factor 3A subunit 1-like [Hydractinia symbiolongicarpus]|uniref:splicing factor 3A subunit 1-like n=1 Tax=Hydractinia symbiolongicarpus TaxID=13093 RepID=UPI00254DCBBE|nr:splicing factor 3A subunit 1-like [Hydractinia symbiolongicarpus]
MPPVAIEVDDNSGKTEVEKDGKIYERSSEDGELYSKPTIGIIYPPPEVRNIVDRTALFVARNGPEFEDRIRANEADNVKFNFLNPNDPYHAYYEYKLKDFRENDQEEPAPQEKEAVKPAQQQTKLKQSAQIVETIIPKDPPPVYEYMADPPTISAIDLDIVKLTAQFVAKNGKDFLTSLMTREQRNYQFDFLRPQHSLFQYFTRLVEQYTKILLPPDDITKKLSKDFSEPWKVLDCVKYRVEWQRFQDREKRKVEDEKERERIAFAQIDWHDFVVVETVNFRENETANLPTPVTKDQLGARLLAQERFEKMKKSGEVNAEEIEMDVEEEEEGEEELYQPFQQEDNEEKGDEEKVGSDMEEESDDEEGGAKPPEMPPPVMPPMPGLNAPIRKNYDPKASKQSTSSSLSDKYLISPLTGEKVPVESMANHMKVNLLDPRWKVQQEKLIEEKRQQDDVLAQGVHIGDSLKQLAERRSDIFGVGIEETFIGKKLGEEEASKKPTKEIWDGHTASMERATKLAHSNITFEDQIKAIHKSKGLLPSEEAEKIGPAVPFSRPTESAPPVVSTPTEPIIIETSSAELSKPPQPPTTLTGSSIDKPVEGPPPLLPRNMPVSSAPVSAPPHHNMQMGMPPNMPPNMPMPPPMSNQTHPPNMPMMRPPSMLPPNMMMPPQMQNMPPHQPGFMPPPMPSTGIEGNQLVLPSPAEDEEPATKKARVETETDLVPEDTFVAQNRLPVTFRVQVPELPDKTEWQCQGQVLKICLPVTDQCSVIKAKINEMINMPAGKQKLQLGTLFIKDSNTLAYYNFSSSTLIQLHVKERGGRKK